MKTSKSTSSSVSIIFIVFLLPCLLQYVSSNRAQSELYLCLHNCALCVRQWESGLYNGEKCARKCLKHKSDPYIVDPDCTSLKLFNYGLIKSRLNKVTEDEDD